MLNIDGHSIDYQESRPGSAGGPGEGPAVLFVPGSYSTPAAWTGLRKRLPPNYRCIATSICGYGGTGETRGLDDFDMAHEVRVVEAVARHAGAPVHLVGHSFGGTIALAAALAGRVDVRSIATFEANPLALIRERGRADLYAETFEMSQAFERAHDAGERDAAGRIIDFWGGAGSFAAMPEPVRDYCRATTFANVLDWRTAFAFQASLADYSRLTVPAMIVRGGLANPAMVEISDGLAAGLPNARAESVEGASHFLITSHADACARLLTDFLAQVGG
jgi:pimeloyl-ACP methyl ester carboxylesterase